jgi:hypothetical protein
MSGDVSMADLVAANPNFEQQMRDWQTERHQKGEDPTDWQAFRELETFIGAPDPGENAPSEFMSFTPPAVAAETPSADGSAGEVTQATDAATTEAAEAAPKEKSWAERWGTGSSS